MLERNQTSLVALLVFLPIFRPSEPLEWRSKWRTQAIEILSSSTTLNLRISLHLILLSSCVIGVLPSELLSGVRPMLLIRHAPTLYASFRY